MKKSKYLKVAFEATKIAIEIYKNNLEKEQHE